MPPKPGPKPTGKALSNAERQRRYMERLKANRVTNAVAELQTELASARDHAERLQAELTEARALVGHLQAENARLTAALNPVSDADSATEKPVTNGKARGYPAEIKAMAVRLADEGQPTTEIRAAILDRLGRAPDISNMARLVRSWRAALVG
jgi:chromosome segregation ATPase